MWKLIGTLFALSAVSLACAPTTARLAGIARDSSDTCVNRDAGYSVMVPRDLEASDDCRVFDPDLARLTPSSDAETVTVLASTVQRDVDAIVDRIRIDGRHEVLDAAPVRVAGADDANGWRLELRSLVDELQPAGTQSYLYVIPLRAEMALVVATTDAAPGVYAENRGLLDELVAGLEVRGTDPMVVAR